MIVVHEISGPQLALLSAVQDLVRRHVPTLTDWSEKDRQFILDLFEDVEVR